MTGVVGALTAMPEMVKSGVPAACVDLVVLLTAAALMGGCAQPRVAPSDPVKNIPPAVSLVAEGGNSCLPTGSSRSCTITMIAQATAPDSDALAFEWSASTEFDADTGACRRAADPSRAICTIVSPGQIVVARVAVTDGSGHRAEASAQLIGEGTNHAPTIRLTGPYMDMHGGPDVGLGGQLEDPDEPQLAFCGRGRIVSTTATGDCQPTVSVFTESCLAGVNLFVQRTATTGSCALSIGVRDSAGLVATTILSFVYPSAPGPLSTVRQP